MDNLETKNHAEALRLLPSVDALLRTAAAQKLIPQTGARHLAALARAAPDLLRRNLQEKINNQQTIDYSREDLLAEAEKHLAEIWQNEQNAGLQRVINATGVIIHTNLGRAPLSENARRAIFEKASRYCNLEYNLETGKRGRRGGPPAPGFGGRGGGGWGGGW